MPILTVSHSRHRRGGVAKHNVYLQNDVKEYHQSEISSLYVVKTILGLPEWPDIVRFGQLPFHYDIFVPQKRQLRSYPESVVTGKAFY